MMCVAGIVAVSGSVASICPAGIGESGDVVPADPASWTTSTDARVGNTGTGSVTVNGGSDLVSMSGYLGFDPGSNGTVTVSGAGSTWTNGSHLLIGYLGVGTLDVINGATVNSESGLIAQYPGSTGAVTVSGAGSRWTNSTLAVSGAGDGTLNIAGGGLVEVTGSTSTHIFEGSGVINFNGGTLTTGCLLSDASDLSGAGTINTNGLVTDLDLLFDASHGLTQTLTLNGHGQNITVNLDVSTLGVMGAGYSGNGSMHISDGLAVQSNGGYLGYNSGSGGVVTVSGAGSTWDISIDLHVGSEGNGTLGITGGGTVSNRYGHIGYDGDSTGAVTVSGAGSTWSNSGEVYVGRYGNGTLDIADGGTVSNSYGNIGHGSASNSAVTVNGAGSTWNNSSGLSIGHSGDGMLEITNGGTVSNTDGIIGYGGGSGTVTVTGAGSTWDNSGSLYVGTSGSGTVTVQEGGEVRVGKELSIVAGSALNVLGGTVRFARPDPMLGASEDMNFTFGTLAFDCDVTVTGTGLVNDIFGALPTISGANGLEISGTATLGTRVTLDGGTLSVGSLVNASMLTFNNGTLKLTQDTLTIGLGGMLGRTVEVADGQTIQVASDATVETTGLLLISGGAFAPAWTTNFGEIRLGAGSSPGAALLAGGGLGNYGLVTGDGRISAALTNLEGGLISVGPGQRLLLTGGENSNAGTMTTTGGEIDVLRALNNGGQINVVDGTFSVGGILMNIGPSSYISGQGDVTLQSGDVLSNTGTVGFSAATASLYGDIHNGAGGLIAVAGESTATFVGTVENFGEIYVGDGSKAVFLSRVIGTGDFPGPGGGTVEFVDGFTPSPSPGPSPAAVSFGGNVLFAPTASLEIELGGTAAGDEHDYLNIAGDLTPGGTLQVSLIDEFAPDVGDTFDILDWGTLSAAAFDSVELPELFGRKAWDTSDLYVTGQISVIGMLPGDTDIDWDVDAMDYDNFIAGFGGVADWRTDFNEDGVIDIADFTLQRAHYGEGVSPPSDIGDSATTPEPATLSLLLLGGLVVIRRRRS